MVNRTILVGRVKAKPESIQVGKTTKATFTLATEETFVDKGGQKQKKVEWHRVIVWGKLAEVCAQYLDKGSLIYMEGKITYRQWEKDGQKHYATETVMDKLKMLGGGRREEEPDEDRDLPF